MRRTDIDKDRYRVTSVYVDYEKVSMLRALGFNLSEIVDEVLDYALVGRLGDFKEKLRQRVMEEIKKREEREKRRKEYEKDWRKRLREAINKPLY